MCGSCKFTLASKEKLSGFPVIVDANSLANYKTKEIMVCIYSASPSKFKAAFKDVMLNGTPLSDEINSQKDVENLALIHDNGQDIEKFGVDVLKVARAVARTHTPEEIQNASCTIGLQI